MQAPQSASAPSFTSNQKIFFLELQVREKRSDFHEVIDRAVAALGQNTEITDNDFSSSFSSTRRAGSRPGIQTLKKSTRNMANISEKDLLATVGSHMTPRAPQNLLKDKGALEISAEPVFSVAAHLGF